MTYNIHNQEVVKISTKPFLIIALLIITIISIGSIANNIRMRNRFNSLVDHSKVIYNAHNIEIENIFKMEENLPKIKSLLEIINIPEKDVYLIDIVRKIEDTWVLYDSQNEFGNDNYNINRTTISHKDISSVQSYVETKDNRKFRYQPNLKDLYINFYRPYPHYDKDFLISILPINQSGNIVGYFIVATSKVQPN